MAALREVGVTRYVEPLREGGSLPGLVEADDDGLYVAKFRGAGQGPGALVAEVVVGELARALGLPVPELVALVAAGRAGPGRARPRDPGAAGRAARASTSASTSSPGRCRSRRRRWQTIDAALAADIVWLDALTTNVDRTPRNPNLLVWHGRPWMIDHGAALYRQYGERPLARHRARAASRASPSTCCSPRAAAIAAADERLAARRAVGAMARPSRSCPTLWLGRGPAGAAGPTWRRFFGERLRDAARVRGRGRARAAVPEPAEAHDGH